MALNLLPKIENSEQYSTFFRQSSIWEPAIAVICQRHGLSEAAVRAVKGSHIVYRSGDVWIKLMAPLYAKDMVFEVACLRAVADSVSFQTPKIIAEGEIESWPYVLISHVEGERVGDIFEQLETKEQVRLAIEFAQATKQIHSVPTPSIIRNRRDWNQFIESRWLGFHEHHSKKNMSEVWLGNLQSFVHQFQLQDFQIQDPVFLHSDLTWDHFLVKNENGNWKLSGIIDFADAQAGHPEYDMGAPIAFLFRKKRDVIANYARAMGVRESGERLSNKLLVWTILHLYSDLKNYFADEMAARNDGDFAALAKEVYPV